MTKYMLLCLLHDITTVRRSTFSLFGTYWQDDPKTLAIMMYCPIKRWADFSFLSGSHKTPLRATVTFQPPPLTTTLSGAGQEEVHSSSPSKSVHSSSGNSGSKAGRKNTKHSLYPFVQPFVTTTVLTTASRQMPPAAPSLTTARYVCAVQQFQNRLTGPMIYLFARYYLQLGWHVLIYDQGGSHQSFLEPLLEQSSRLRYFPFTVFELLFPARYKYKYGDGSGAGPAAVGAIIWSEASH